jgi:hypothetical protein
MRIGFSSIYSWRPHVEHLYYLAGLARQAGHHVAYLTCDADLPSCYARELRPERPGWLHCTFCRAGGIRSYAKQAVSSIGALEGGASLAPGAAREWSCSSAGTLGRFESPGDFAGSRFEEIVQRLAPAVDRTYLAAREWIERERLDAVCLFNGRLDVTRAVLEAAKDARIRYISMERTWFGDGMQLLPDEDCIGLKTVDAMVSAWAGVPLSGDQGRAAASHIASRFLRRNTREWRAYNTTAAVTDWPARGPRRILLVPGSRNEVWAHPDWASGWREVTDAYDAIMKHWQLQPAEIVLRCHPNWGQKIGSASGEPSEVYFSTWARQRDIRVIASTDAISTHGLMEHADAVVVSGGSSAIEAGILGKQVIAVAPSVYQRAGIQHTVYDPAGLADLTYVGDLDPDARRDTAARIRRQTLRFCYTMIYRIPQYVRHVRCISTTEYAYLDGADPSRLSELVRTGKLQPDDPRAAADTAEEDEVLQQISARRWEQLMPPLAAASSSALRPVHRRWMYRPIGQLRQALPRGDL